MRIILWELHKCAGPVPGIFAGVENKGCLAYLADNIQEQQDIFMNNLGDRGIGLVCSSFANREIA
jgi:hypothetical protein